MIMLIFFKDTDAIIFVVVVINENILFVIFSVKHFKTHTEALPNREILCTSHAQYELTSTSDYVIPALIL